MSVGYSYLRNLKEYKMRYKIKDEELAKELHIDGLEGALVIDVKKIPPGMTIEEYIKFLEENNIILTY